MPISASLFGIHNSTVSLVVDLVILFLVVVWLALIYWTYADARRRVADPMLIGCATAASLFPYVGTLVYLIVRPPEYLEDVRERELEMQAAEARLAEVGFHLCPHCDHEVEKDFLRCPNCMRKLKDPCANCGKPLDPAWKICPFCETEIGTVTPRRVRRRREAPPEQAVLTRDGIAAPPRDGIAAPPRDGIARDGAATAREQPRPPREATRPPREATRPTRDPRDIIR